MISHDHYDHLDRRTIIALDHSARERGWNTTFIVPLGIGAHLAYWGVPESRIVELDWWQRARISSIRSDLIRRPAECFALQRRSLRHARHPHQ